MIRKFVCSAGDPGSKPRLGRPPWSKEWLPTPVFLSENSMDRGTWLTTVLVVLESDTTETLTLSLSIIKKQLTSQGNSQEGETIRNNSVKFLAQVSKKKKKIV